MKVGYRDALWIILMLAGWALIVRGTVLLMYLLGMNFLILSPPQESWSYTTWDKLSETLHILGVYGLPFVAGVILLLIARKIGTTEDHEKD